MASIIKSGNNLDRYYKEVLLEYDGEQGFLLGDEYGDGSIAVYQNGDTFKTYKLIRINDEQRAWESVELPECVLTDIGSIIIKSGETLPPTPPTTTYTVTIDAGSMSNSLEVSANTTIVLKDPSEYFPYDSNFFNRYFVSGDQEYQPGDDFTVTNDVIIHAEYMGVIRLEGGNGELVEVKRIPAYFSYTLQSPDDYSIEPISGFDMWYNPRNISFYPTLSGVWVDIGYNDYLQSSPNKRFSISIQGAAEGEVHKLDDGQIGYARNIHISTPSQYGISQIDNFTCYKIEGQEGVQILPGRVHTFEENTILIQSDEPVSYPVYLFNPLTNQKDIVDYTTTPEAYTVKSMAEYGYTDEFFAEFECYIFGFPAIIYVGDSINLTHSVEGTALSPYKLSDLMREVITYNKNGTIAMGEGTYSISKFNPIYLTSPEEAGIDETEHFDYWIVEYKGSQYEYQPHESFYPDINDNETVHIRPHYFE